MTNDIIFAAPTQFGAAGTKRFEAQANTTVINPGEPVSKALGAQYVTAMATNKPVVATDFLAGIAESVSTQTTALDGFVDVFPLVPNTVYLIKPKVPATFFGSGVTPSQSTYNALVGDRVLMDLTAGTYTLLAADGATSGCVIEDIDVTKSGGRVAFSIRMGVNYLS